MTFDDFIDACEPDAEGSADIIKAFSEMLDSQEKKMGLMKGGDSDEAGGEKKR
jgi:hypothetical protein